VVASLRGFSKFAVVLEFVSDMLRSLPVVVTLPYLKSWPDY